MELLTQTIGRAAKLLQQAAFTLRRDTLSSIRYSEALNFTPSSGTIQRTARHGILEQKSSDLQVSG